MKINKTSEMVGHKYGRITVLSIMNNTPTGRRKVLGKCDCGTQKDFCPYGLRKGIIKSCGCYAIERAVTFNTTHGKSNRSEYRIWSKIKDRCRNEKNPAYKYYGGRGIILCIRWSDFNTFLFDMGDRPSMNHSIDRINVDGNYEPNNCRWATASQQANNTRRNKRIEYMGLNMTHAQWEEYLDMPTGHMRRFLKKPFKEVYDWYYPKIGIKKTSHNWIIRKGATHSLSKKVFCLNNNTEYPSAAEAERKLNLPEGCASSCCRGIIKQTKGYTFKFV